MPADFRQMKQAEELGVSEFHAGGDLAQGVAARGGRLGLERGTRPAGSYQRPSRITMLTSQRMTLARTSRSSSARMGADSPSSDS